MIYGELRKKYPSFIYESYNYRLNKDELILKFYFRVDPGIKFSPTIRIKKVGKSFSKFNIEILNKLIFHLGLVEIPSYWKATCSPEIVIKAGELDARQIIWWKKLIIMGMGQFFYENKIDFNKDNFLTIRSFKKEIDKSPVASVDSDKLLIPVGGGKDSAVTLSILGQLKNVGAFIMNPASPSALSLAKTSKLKEIIEVERIIDPQLRKLNEKGFLNGHTPYSAVLYFNSLFVAYLFGYKYIAFSNERSSEEENLNYLNIKINHQYSKTFEFENKFREYNFEYLSNIKSFSFLRPLYDIQISKLFASSSDNFELIRSCNIGRGDDIWCCECAKCLSTFILLSPFLDRKKILKIFPENLYGKEYLISLLHTLIDKSDVKPFECLGTRDEIKSALFLSIAEYKDDLPLLLKEAQKLLKNVDYGKLAKDLLNSWGEDGNIPLTFKELLKKIYARKLYIKN